MTRKNKEYKVSLKALCFKFCAQFCGKRSLSKNFKIIVLAFVAQKKYFTVWLLSKCPKCFCSSNTNAFFIEMWFIQFTYISCVLDIPVFYCLCHLLGSKNMTRIVFIDETLIPRNFPFSASEESLAWSGLWECWRNREWSLASNEKACVSTQLQAFWNRLFNSNYP